MAAPSLWNDDDEDDDTPTGWVQYSDGSWAAVDSTGTIAEAEQLFQLSLDVAVANFALPQHKVIDIEPTSVVDHQ